MDKVSRISVRSGLWEGERTVAEVVRGPSAYSQNSRIYRPTASSLERIKWLTKTGAARISFVHFMPNWISVWIEPEEVRDDG